MPLVAHNDLPTFERLREEGATVIPEHYALEQEIRELHIGLLNMMPDKALEATERQFFRLIGEANQIAQFYLHCFSFPELGRDGKGQAHVDRYYESFESIKEQGLDALIITGANVLGNELSEQPFWKPLIGVVDWAYENVTSTLCSCLATHAVMEFRYGKKRRPLGFKRWGVYSHRVVDRGHPLVQSVNTRFDVPHSRFNQIDRRQFEEAGVHILVEGAEPGVHLAVSEDRFRLVFFQGHPEYDLISLLKEYKREVKRFAAGECEDYPPFPENYFSAQAEAILDEYRAHVVNAVETGAPVPGFPEEAITASLDNTWHDSAEAVINNWIGKVYQITNIDRTRPFQPDINPRDPLGLKD